MALTPTDNWINAVDKAGSITPVYLVTWSLLSSGVTITRKFITTNMPRLTDSDGNYSNAIPNLSDISSLSLSLDIVDRTVSIGEFHLEFLDDKIKNIFKTAIEINQRVLVEQG